MRWERIKLHLPAVGPGQGEEDVPLFGRDLTFYSLLEKQAGMAHSAAKVFHELAVDWGRVTECAERVDQIEHEADEVTHELARRANKTFVTPLDKEDLRALSGGLDDITDAIEAAVGRVVLYDLKSPRPDVEPLVAQLVEITRLTYDAVAALPHIHNVEELHERFVHIHKIENDSDTLFREALRGLFSEPNADAIMVMKWKEIYDRIEMAVDKCEDVANTVEGVVVKYA